jgi:hypothetical protein
MSPICQKQKRAYSTCSRLEEKLLSAGRVWSMKSGIMQEFRPRRLLTASFTAASRAASCSRFFSNKVNLRHRLANLSAPCLRSCSLNGACPAAFCFSSRRCSFSFSICSFRAACAAALSCLAASTCLLAVFSSWASLLVRSRTASPSSRRSVSTAVRSNAFCRR